MRKSLVSLGLDNLSVIKLFHFSVFWCRMTSATNQEFRAHDHIALVHWVSWLKHLYGSFNVSGHCITHWPLTAIRTNKNSITSCFLKCYLHDAMTFQSPPDRPGRSNDSLGLDAEAKHLRRMSTLVNLTDSRQLVEEVENHPTPYPIPAYLLQHPLCYPSLHNTQCYSCKWTAFLDSSALNYVYVRAKQKVVFFITYFLWETIKILQLIYLPSTT